MRNVRGLRWAAAAATVVALLSPSSVAQAAPAVGATMAASAFTAKHEGSPLRRAPSVAVMTRNIYVGGDITRPVRAASGKNGRDALLALGHANHDLRAIVNRTDFTVRGRLLAREIAHTRPDLVGLQEVALWRHGPIQLDPSRLGVPNALTVDYDFLGILLADLAREDAHYRVANQQQESDVEAPAFLGVPLAGDTVADRDPSTGLWPSDHAGVVLRLRFRPLDAR